LQITFNPITSNAIKKVLNKILTAENCVASSATLSFIAESCGGDIRHAIHSLQFLCLVQSPILCAWEAEGGTKLFSNNAKRRKISTDVDRKHGSFLSSNKQNSFGCRDSVLTVFHALGKVLHNKRIIEEAKISGVFLFLLFVSVL
jgi:cell cycle checkpoint protein